MFRHADIWQALDRLAQENGLSVSGLARRAGLDPTTFNRSKRVTRDGRPRWPSTESIAKVLDATGTTLEAFAARLGDETPPAPPPSRTIPLIGFAQAGDDGYFDDAGYPTGAGWDEICFPEVGDPNAYALEVSGDSMEPVYRDGDRLIVSPHSSLRKGDRVVVKTRSGEILVKELARQTATRVELRSLNPAHPNRTIDLADMEWMVRVLWVSQ